MWRQVFEALAAELRAEAVENLTPETRGLILAATVLLDAAGDTRAGDRLAHEPVSQSGDAHGSLAQDDPTVVEPEPRSSVP